MIFGLLEPQLPGFQCPCLRGASSLHQRGHVQLMLVGDPPYEVDTWMTLMWGIVHVPSYHAFYFRLMKLFPVISLHFVLASSSMDSHKSMDLRNILSTPRSSMKASKYCRWLYRYFYVNLGPWGIVWFLWFIVVWRLFVRIFNRILASGSFSCVAYSLGVKSRSRFPFPQVSYRRTRRPV